MAIEIVDFPIKMVMFHSFLYVYQWVIGTYWNHRMMKKAAWE